MRRLQRRANVLADWNRNNPEQPIVVKMPDVWKRVREMGKDRTQRIADTAPKALRQQMRESSARGRAGPSIGLGEVAAGRETARHVHPAKLKKLTYLPGRDLPQTPAVGSPYRRAIDLTGATARMQVRLEKETPTTLADLTTENGGITLGGASGTVDLYLSDAATAAMGWESGVWDLEIVHPSGDVTRLAEGSIGVSKEVTRG